MSKNKKTKTPHFKRKKIKYEEKDPIEELMDLYEEENIDGEQMTGEISEKKDSKEDNDKTLKNLIEIDRTKRRKKFYLISLVVLVILAGSALAGFLFFANQKTFEQQTLNLEIAGPEKAKIGEEFEYLITYQNLGEIELQNSRLIVQYPHGLIVTKTEPELTNHKWVLGNLESGDKGEIIITGSIIDEIDRDQKLTATITFEPSNFHSEFSKETNFSIVLEKPEIEIINTSPSNVTPGQKLSLKTKLKNKGEVAFQNAKLEYIYPENFDLTSANPGAFEDNNKWILSEIPETSNSQEILLNGNFPSDMAFKNDEDRKQSFAVNFYLPGKDGQYHLINQEEFEIKIIDQAVNTYLIINGSTENKNIELSQTLTFSLIAKNNADQTYENVEIKTVINSQPSEILDWNEIEDDYYGKIEKTEAGKEITWTKDQISELQSFEAGNEVVINIVIPVKDFAAIDSNNLETVGQTKINAYSQINLFPSLETDVKPIKSSVIDLTLSSNANIGIKALYYYDDGTPIGIGPMPFEAEKQTQLKVFWDISNNLHELEDIKVTTTLPEYVNWPDEKNVSAGEIEFDSNSQKVTWEINRLPESVNEAHANFAIQVTPKIEHIGELIKLTGNTTFSAKDTAIDSLIIRTKNIITSALEMDDYAETDGKVIP